MYVLCAGAYVARDLDLFGFPVSKCLKWGYFPEVSSHPRVAGSPSVRGTAQILSAQRLISLKHVELQLQLAAFLSERGVDFQLKICGDGPLRGRLMNMAGAMGLSDSVEFLGELSTEEVHLRMSEADIFLGTSDGHEGWGATIYEAMASECAVVACDAMGSVPSLIVDGANGFSYSMGDAESFFVKVERLISDPKLCAIIGAAARNTVTGVWSARVAADRLVKVFDGFPEGISSGFTDGPLSPAG